MSTQPQVTIGSVTFGGIQPPTSQPTLADVLAAIVALDAKVDRLLQTQTQTQASRPKAGYPSLSPK